MSDSESPEVPSREPRAAVDGRRWTPALGLLIAPLVSGVAVAVALALAPPPTLALLVAGIALVLGASFASLAIAARARLPLTVHGALALVAVAGSVAAYFVADRPLAWVPVINLLLVVGGFAIGGAIGARVEHPGHMLPAASVAAAADLASVLHPSGPSNAIAANERALTVIALNVPLPGGVAAPVLGVGDLVFVAIALGVAARHRVSVVGPLVGTAIGAGGSIALAAFLERPIPALVAMGALAVLFTPAFRVVRRADRTATRVALAIAVCVAAGLGLRAALTDSPSSDTSAPSAPSSAPSSDVSAPSLEPATSGP